MSSSSSKGKRSKGFVSSVGRSKSTEVLAPLEKARTDKDLDVWSDAKLSAILDAAHERYDKGHLEEAQQLCDRIYEMNASWTDNLLLLSAVHFQQRNFSESLFFAQQAARVDPSFAEAFSSIGNALKELGDVEAATQAYLKAIQLKPRYPDVYTNLATAYAQSGDSEQAVKTLEMALVLDPSLAEAHNNMGCLLKAHGRMQDAKASFEAAVKQRPGFAVAWNNLGGIHKAMGAYDDALRCYEQAVHLAPAFADAHCNLATLYHDLGQVKDAMASYQKAVSLRPGFAIALSNLGNCYAEAGALKKALSFYQRAVQVEPAYPDALVNMGNALQRLHRVDEAIDAYRVALQRKPDHPHAYCNLGNALRAKGLAHEAAHCYITACKLDPGFAVAYQNLAALYKEQSRLDLALTYFEEAVRISPEFAECYSNMGNALRDAGLAEQAVSAYAKAIQCNPMLADAYANMGIGFKDAGRLDDAKTCLRKALDIAPGHDDAQAHLQHTAALACDWEGQQEGVQALVSTVGRHVTRGEVAACALQPLHALCLPVATETVRSVTSSHAQGLRHSTLLLNFPPCKYRARKPHERIRIGYIGTCFGDHPVGQAVSGAFRHHDATHFEVFVYALTPGDGSAARDVTEGSVEHFKDISLLSDSDAARVINADGIHVLINLTPYLRGDRGGILALRPAPVQTHYFGFPASVGEGLADYIITDAFVSPRSHESQYAEKLVQLPGCCFLADYRTLSAEVLEEEGLPSREDLGLPRHAFVVACFNPPATFSPEFWDLCCDTLRSAKGAVLWLVRWSPTAERNLRAHAEARGVPSDRIIFSELVPRREHLRRCHAADVALDPLLLSGSATALDMLWAGVPLVCRAGDRMSQRTAASITRTVGLGDLVASSAQDMGSLVHALYANPERLSRHRDQLKRNRLTCPVFDTKKGIEVLERALKMIWRRHEDGKAPAHVAVPAPKRSR